LIIPVLGRKATVLKLCLPQRNFHGNHLLDLCDLNEEVLLEVLGIQSFEQNPFLQKKLQKTLFFKVV